MTERLGKALASARETRACVIGEAVKRRLAAVGAPYGPEQIGIPRRRLRDSVLRAQHIRRRFTVLDFAVQTGMLERWLDDLFD